MASILPSETEQELATRAAVESLQAQWPRELELWYRRGSDYYKLPYFFLPAFPSISSARELPPLALFTRLLASSIMLHDELADGDIEASRAGVTSLRIMALQFEAYRVLQPLLPPENPFWERFRRFLAEHSEALIEERRFASGERPWRDYDEASARRLILGKNGVSRVVIAALAALARDERPYEPLIDSLNHFNFATQIYDDIHDWKADLGQRVPTLVLRRALEQPPQALDQVTLKQLSRELFYGGHVQHVLEQALSSLEVAAQARSVAPKMSWLDVISVLRGKCLALLKDVTQIIDANMRRARSQPQLAMDLPAEKGPWQHLAWTGLRFLHKQWKLGFGEARDLVWFSREYNLSIADAYVSGDVFQRALIADVLCDADVLLTGRLRLVIDHEVEYLVSSRLKDGIGGWSYFPTLPELPPDTDDLAQIMQVLLRTGRREDIVRYAEPILEVLLRDGRLADGSFETWIVPATQRSPLQERQAELVRSLWGAGGDADVTANLLYALHLYQPARFASELTRGGHYLEAAQKADGTWETRWYNGPYYGLYVIARLLAAIKPGSLALQNIRRFLDTGQASDGGWGLAGKDSDSLSTSLALLTYGYLQSAKQGAPEDLERVRRGRQYLQAHLHAEDSWPAQDFIYVGAGIMRGSRTLTTAYVAKAALAWNHQEALLTLEPAK
jgi:squalene-hopene/tetraprenyl-beta-curcumene cyclase